MNQLAGQKALVGEGDLLTMLAFQNFPQLFLIHPLSEAYRTAAGLSTERGTQQNTLLRLRLHPTKVGGDRQ